MIDIPDVDFVKKLLLVSVKIRYRFCCVLIFKTSLFLSIFKKCFNMGENLSRNQVKSVKCTVN